MCVHPSRDCIYDEVRASEGMVKYEGLPLREQAESYRRAGFPEHNGLMACGIIVRMMKNSMLRSINRDWWKEIKAWSYHDQISLPFVLWRKSYGYDEVCLDLYDNNFFRVTKHLSNR